MFSANREATLKQRGLENAKKERTRYLRNGFFSLVPGELAKQ
jgi:hypothetical protein